MADRPILFSAPMIQAMLAGRKTQTRRALKPQPTLGAPTRFQRVATCNRTFRSVWEAHDASGPVNAFHKPPFVDCQTTTYAVGDRLWIREAWCENLTRDGALYRADGDDVQLDDGDGFAVANKDGTLRSPWRPSIHMPRAYSRLTLTVTDVRVQRLQEISEDDALAEGIRCETVIVGSNCNGGVHCEETADRYWNGAEPDDFEGLYNAVDSFSCLWDRINGPGSWEKNPWVAAYTFTLHKHNIDAQPEATS